MFEEEMRTLDEGVMEEFARLLVECSEETIQIEFRHRWSSWKGMGYANSVYEAYGNERPHVGGVAICSRNGDHSRSDARV